MSQSIKEAIMQHELEAQDRLKKERHNMKNDMSNAVSKIYDHFDGKIDGLAENMETKVSTVAFRWYVGIFLSVLGTILYVIYGSQVQNKDDIIEIKISQAQMSEKVDLIYNKIVGRD